MGRLLIHDENTNWPRGQEFENIQTGNIFYVDSNTGADTNLADGSQTNPFATGDYATGKCTANNGDVVCFFPGHSEAFAAAAGLDADIAGVTYIGLGNGEDRPTFTFGTTTTADVDIDAANVTIKNVIFEAAIDSLVAMIDVNADDFTLEDCLLREGSTALQALTFVDINGGAANACDRAKIKNCTFLQTGATTPVGDRAIELGEVADSVIIEGCYIDGDFDDAGIHNPTGKVLTNLVLKDNVIHNRATGQHAVELVSACTGSAVNNYMYGDTLGTIFDPGSLKCFGNLETDAVDQAAVQTPSTSAGYPDYMDVPTADTSTNSLMRDVIGNKDDAVVTTPSTSASITAYAKACVNQTKDILSIDGGNVIAVTATLSSATWNTVASHEVANVSGLNRVRIIPYCTTNLVGGANAGSGTLTFGDASSASRLITATTASTIDADEIWVTSSTTHEKVINHSAIFDVITDDQDIGYTIGTSALTAGVLIFVIASEPLEATATVAAGAGGTL